ncbi:MAG: ribosome-associated translation inhibitor RaiA [bacterium]|nr:ribosome-associated translation inhibitor RaiA [bacterium]
MQITVKATQLKLSPALRTHVEEKLGALEKLVRRWDAAGAVSMSVEIARTTRHHKKGQIYYAEANLTLPGGMLRAREEHWDLRAAVIKVRTKLKKEIDKYKERHAP